jgi:hypothetical protein
MTGKFSHRAVPASAPRPAAATAPRAPRRPPTPVLIGGGAALLIAVASLMMLREAPAAGVEPAAQVATLAGSGPAVAERAAEDTERAFAGQDPELRRAVEDVLARYARALETIDGALLGDARPDMPAKARAALMADREGATNIAADLRVLAVARRGSQATVRIRRTEVVVAGRAVDRPSVEETLRFQRDGGAWVLRPSR